MSHMESKVKSNVKSKVKSKKSRAVSDAKASANPDGIVVRFCDGLAEFEGCIEVERAVWKAEDIDLVPMPLFVVAARTGGQVIGAFDGPRMVGFTMAIAGWRGGKPLLHSHMTATLDGYRDRGIGRRLKLFQRTDALARGISLVEWTFDPLMIKNAYFNLMRLGAIARNYLPNAYGITTSALHAGLPTDRFVAEWHLRSPRVKRVLAGKAPVPAFTKKARRISIPANLHQLATSNPAEAAQRQSGIRGEFAALLSKGYAAVAIEQTPSGADYVLEPYGAKGAK